MGLINEILMLLFSLIGIFVGIALTFIAPEELKTGNKYFIIFRRSLFILISLLIGFYFFQAQQFLYLSLFVLLAGILFFLDFKLKNNWNYVSHYLLFLMSYFLNQNINFHLILVSLIFLYGLPTGTLLMVKKKK